MNLRAAAVLACLATAPSARARAEVVVERPPSALEQVMATIHGRIDAAVIARPPKLVPPKAVKLGWKLGKLGTLDLGAPLAALTAGDLDGDGKAELYAVTPREVIAIGIVDKKPRILGRVAFSGDATAVPPRDVVATAVIDTGAVVASASGWVYGLRVSWQKGALVGSPSASGFMQCPGELVPLAPGRNFFGDAATGTYATRCSNAIDTEGYPLRARGVLSLANKLDIAVERCAAIGLGCQPTSRYEYSGVGIAFEVADVDRDGKPELVYAGAGAPGDPDALKIVTLGDDDKKQARLRKAFTAGGVAGIAVADVDGSGTPTTIAAVRLVGAARVDLWRLE